MFSLFGFENSAYNTANQIYNSFSFCILTFLLSFRSVSLLEMFFITALIELKVQKIFTLSLLLFILRLHHYQLYKPAIHLSITIHWPTFSYHFDQSSQFILKFSFGILHYAVLIKFMRLNYLLFQQYRKCFIQNPFVLFLSLTPSLPTHHFLFPSLSFSPNFS